MSTLQLGTILSSSSPMFLASNSHIPKNVIPSLSFLPTNFVKSSFHFAQSTCRRTYSHGNPRIGLFKITCSATSENLNKGSDVVVEEKSVSVILLSGGKGKRMGASMPKQYLPLLGQPIALYSFYTFSRMPQVKEIIVVCDPSYRDIFEDAKEHIQVDLKFALPGKERQDSVYSGLQVSRSKPTGCKQFLRAIGLGKT